MVNAKPDGDYFDAPSNPPIRSSNTRPTRVRANGSDRVDNNRLVYNQKRPVGGVVKRIFDISVSIIASVVILPIILFLWCLVKLTSKGPGIFTQERGGLNGKPFKIYKLRSMTGEYNANGELLTSTAYVTKIGRFLRATSFDELPQFLNVLKGDMSLVGPRPHMVEHDTLLSNVAPDYECRFASRPGITGLAQVSGSRGAMHSEEDMRVRTKLDVHYVQHWTFVGDIKILIRTLGVEAGT